MKRHLPNFSKDISSCSGNMLELEDSVRSISTLESLSFRSLVSCPDNRGLPSVSKMEELKQILSEMKDAYTLWRTSEMMLDCCISSANEICPQLAVKVNEITTAASVQKKVQMRSRTGKTCNVLGLDQEDLKVAANKSLTSTEKHELCQSALSLLQARVQQLSDQKIRLKGLFGVHCQKVVPKDSLMTEEREQLARLYLSVQDKLDEACQLLLSCSHAIEELLHVVPDSKRELSGKTFSYLLNKAKFLHTTTSILKIKMEEKLYKNTNRTEAINQLGDTLKTSVEESREQLKILEKSLTQYEKKEATSEKFKEIVLEYNKIKTKLNHKQQTLALLNNPDVSF